MATVHADFTSLRTTIDRAIAEILIRYPSERAVIQEEVQHLCKDVQQWWLANDRWTGDPALPHCGDNSEEYRSKLSTTSVQVRPQALCSSDHGLDKDDGIPPVDRDDDASHASVSQGVPLPCHNISRDPADAPQTPDNRAAKPGLNRDDVHSSAVSHAPGSIGSVDADKPSTQGCTSNNNAPTATVGAMTTDVGSALGSDQADACGDTTTASRETSGSLPILPSSGGKGPVDDECVQRPEHEDDDSSLTTLDDISVHNSSGEEDDPSSDDEIIVNSASTLAKPTVSEGATAHKKGSSSVLASKPEGKKRKSSLKSRKTPHNQKRLKLPVENSISSMKEHTPLPDDIISSKMISQEISDALQTYDAQLIWLVTRLFYAIASPEAFSQLRDACISSRNLQGPKPSPRDEHISHSMRALDELDMATCAASIIRRYHLVKLVEFREARQAFHLQQDADRPPVVLKYGHIRLRSRKPNEGQGRALSSALRDMLIEAHPRLQQIPENETSSHDEYQRQNNILKRRLGCARNWYALERRFSRSILALVPVGGLYDIHNHDVERLSKEAFGVLLDLLDKHRGEFLRKMGELMLEKSFDILLQRDSAPHYQFEDDGTIDLQCEIYDSPSLLAICDTVA